MAGSVLQRAMPHTLVRCLQWHAADYAKCGAAKVEADERFVRCFASTVHGSSGDTLPSAGFALGHWWRGLLSHFDGVLGAEETDPLHAAFDCATFSAAQGSALCACMRSAAPAARSGGEPLHRGVSMGCATPPKPCARTPRTPCALHPLIPYRSRSTRFSLSPPSPPCGMHGQCA